MKNIIKKFLRPRQFLVCLLVLAMMAASIPAYAAGSESTPFEGAGTSGNPYKISTGEQLLRLAQLVNDGEAPYADSSAYYLLTQNISISVYGQSYNLGKGWIPIGDTVEYPFRGHFDGGGHQIAGLYINGNAINYGLFGVVAIGATVEKVLLPGARITGVRNVGAVAGDVSGTITGCAYLAAADGTDLVQCTDKNAGGIAGYVEAAGVLIPGGLVESCYSTGRVSGNNTVGGVAGSVNGKVQNCYSTGAIGGTVGVYVGGVAGTVNGTQSDSFGGTVQNCYATGLVMGGSCIGGVAGGVYERGRVQCCVALNPSVIAGNSLGGRVVGVISAAENTSSILAFGGMVIAVGGAIKTPLDPNLDGLAFTIGTGFPTGYFDVGPWVSAADMLPGLGAAADMPVHLVPPASDLTITTASLPDCAVGTTYSVKLETSGGTGDVNNYTWSATGVPLGMRVTSTGRMLGMPTGSGVFPVRITVTDTDDAAVSKTLELNIAPRQDGPLSSWTERNMPDSLTDAPINDIAYDGHTFAGVGEGIMTSSDGVNWTEVMPKPNHDSPWAFGGAAYGEGTFVAVGWKADSGMISTKTSAGAWTEKTPSGCRQLTSAAYVGNGTFIAVGYNTALHSNDLGNTWSAVTTPQLQNGSTFILHGVAADGNGHAVAVGEYINGESLLWYSSDNGQTWLATASRIEGTGLNSVAYGNGTFVAVGNDADAYFSRDGGRIWEDSEQPDALDYMTPVMHKIVFGDNIFVAAGQCEDGQYNVISSADSGMTWTAQASEPDTNFQALAYGNNSFVKAGYTVAGNAGRLYQSAALTPLSLTADSVPSGTVGSAYSYTPSVAGGIAPYTWSATGLPQGLIIDTATGTISGVPSASGSFSAVVTVTDLSSTQKSDNADISITASGGGPALPLAWSVRNTGAGGAISHLAYGNGIYTATDSQGNLLASSDGGNTWSVSAAASAINPSTVIYDNGRFFAAGKGILTSADGISWSSALSSPYNNTSFVIYNIQKAGGILLATGSNSSIFESSDGGLNWTKVFVPNPVSVTFNSFSYVASGDRFVGLAEGTIYTLSKIIGQTLYTNVSTHSDADNTPYFKALYCLNGKYYAVKSDGVTDVVMVSSDLRNWARENSLAVSVTQMVYDGPDNAKKFVIAGNGGVLLTSTDGITWTPQESGSTINSIAYGGGIFVAVGNQGKILSSSDGVTWSQCTSGTTKDLYSVAYENGCFIVGGAEQTILLPGAASAYIASVTAGTTVLTSTGGTSMITVRGANLTDGIKVTAFLGGTATAVTGATTGNATIQTATLTFPANAGSTDKVYTVKVSLDNGSTWKAQTAAVTVAKPTSSGNNNNNGNNDSNGNSGNSGNSGSSGEGTATDTGTKITVTTTDGSSSVTGTMTESNGGTQIVVKNDAFNKLNEADKPVSVSVKTATVTFDKKAVDAIGVATGTGDIMLTVRRVSASELPEADRVRIGLHPVYDFTVKGGTTTVSSFGGGQATVSIPYTPAASELDHPDSIIVWYVDDSGTLVCVPSGRYDPTTGTVTFMTTHFSRYAVGYNPMSFNDVTASAWYNKAVSFIAARGITSGNGNGRYRPEAKLTRGEFIVLMMRAYEIAPDANSADNFSDAGNTYYTGYLAAAKHIGISSGVGNNMFAPGKEITRQEMFTLLYNSLKIIGQLPQSNSGKTLADFTDAGKIESWGKEAMAMLVKTGMVDGSEGLLTPGNTTTRAEMAQVLYNLSAK